MAQTKKAQVLMEPEEYTRLEKIAREQGISLSELIRNAVRERYLSKAADRQKALDEILGLGIPAEDWSNIDAELAEGRDGCLP